SAPHLRVRRGRPMPERQKPDLLHGSSVRPYGRAILARNAPLDVGNRRNAAEPSTFAVAPETRVAVPAIGSRPTPPSRPPRRTVGRLHLDIEHDFRRVAVALDGEAVDAAAEMLG